MSGHMLRKNPESAIPANDDPSLKTNDGQSEKDPRAGSAGEAGDLLSQVIAHVGDPIVLTDAKARILLLDPIARELFGSSNTPQALPVVANRGKLDTYLAAFTFSFLNHQDKRIRLYDPQSRSDVEYAARSSKIYDQSGHLTHTLTVLRDFSTWESAERTQMERRMLEMEKFAATGKLAGTIAHEINNPMEAIKNAIYLLKDRLGPDSQPIYDALKSEADRVTRIVRQMLGLYRNAAHVGKFDLNGVVEDTLTLFARPLEKSGIVVRKQLGSLPTMRGSADQFRQLLSNLVVNAQDSMQGGGKLTIRTQFLKSAREGYGQMKIVIADTGSGISPGIRKTMFEPFVTTKGEKGTGLGLWIVQGVVDGHTGRIQVRSRVGKGTVFRLLFPVAGA